jgi:hypothetical protein
MATYNNSYEILRDVREALHEYSSDYTQGVEEDGAFSNHYLMRKINNAQRYVYQILFTRIPDQFLTTGTATFSGSSYTLPWNFAKLHELRDENGFKVYHIRAKDSKYVGETGSDSYYYQVGNTYKLDRDNVSKDYIIQYYTKPRDLHTGRITASGSLNITLDSDAKKIDDYYNGMVIENVNSDWVDTISDYTSARVATIIQTSLQIDDDYGLVPEIPEPFHFLIPLKAVLDIRMEHPLALTNVGPNEIGTFGELIMFTLAAFGDNDEDIGYNDIFNDFNDGVVYTHKIIEVN